MPKIFRRPLPTFAEHVARWKDGCGSGICSARGTRRVFARGSVPADVLFVGEAPGEAENTLAAPFVGPAGQLLDLIVSKAFSGVGFGGRPVRPAFTNIVCCIPRYPDPETGRRTEKGSPDHDDVMCCAPRLAEMIRIADGADRRLRLVVAVGREAASYVRPGMKHSVEFPRPIKVVEIVHPSAILRGPFASRSLAAHRAAVTVRTALLEDTPPEPTAPYAEADIPY